MQVESSYSIICFTMFYYMLLKQCHEPPFFNGNGNHTTSADAKSPGAALASTSICDSISELGLFLGLFSCVQRVRNDTGW